MKDTSTNVILSIKPIYSQAIMSGIKKVEFRKKRFKKEVDKVYIYSSSPEKMIIGYFTVANIVQDTPENLWNKFGYCGAITKTDFFDYYKDVATGFSIVIDKVCQFETGIDPIEFLENFSAPQSYIYVEEKRLLTMHKNNRCFSAL